MRTLIAIWLALLAMSPPIALANDEDSSKSRAWWRQRSVLASGRVVQGDYVAFAPRVRISGTVNGDVYVAAWSVVIDGVVNGDLIVAARKVVISGKVMQDVRAAGGHAVISGSIGRNVTIAAADIQVTEPAAVEGNLLAAGGEVELMGHIHRDARIAAGELMVASQIDGDLAVASADVRLTPQAVVGGKLRYWGDKGPSIAEGATVRGLVQHRPLPTGWEDENFFLGLAMLRVVAIASSFVSTLLLGLILVHVYPLFTRRVAATIRTRPLRSFGWGAAALLIVPIVAAALALTLIGLPAGIILMALFLATAYLCRIFVMTYLGQLVLRRMSDSAPGWSFVTGLVIYALLSLVPIVGEIVTLVTVLFGLGALLSTKRDLVADLREQGVV